VRSISNMLCRKITGLTWGFTIFWSMQEGISTDLTEFEARQILKCAQEGKILDMNNKECVLPLSEGFCGDEELAVLNQNGVVACEQFKCGSKDLLWNGEICTEMFNQKGCDGPGEMMLYNITGGIECGCEEGWGMIEGRCYQHSTQGPCKEGELLINSGVPIECDCMHYLSCPNFVTSVNSLDKTNKQALTYRLGVERLTAQVCNVQQQHVCCNSLFELRENLNFSEVLQLLNRYHRKPLTCTANPCSPSTVPWPNRSDCLQLETPTSEDECVLMLKEENGKETVKCEKYEFDIAIRNVPMAYKHKCSRGRIWSRFRKRCVKNFF